ncbi:MarR family transcriptional regulator (plasmid) [Agrobacterium leguminum]|uniref:Transcriptional regulator n=1 Tax=Agrobacterium deltaense NCPPB 1641 TaxID=1183425 RepID=A0A1S7UAV5_9HYPH|nr:MULTISPECIES: MarR family transcriptional regulator [Agrobacterium]WFS69730.1 MarR family transcriptional regulator [Agrobacterium leguminum]CVI64033.1 Transcriptional regulator [Agrobacterium deltaense NCPPB 1641]
MKEFEFGVDLYETPGHLIRRLQQAAVSIFMAETAAVGLDLTPPQFGALTMAKHHPGIDQVTLAGLIAYDKVTIGDVVSRLVSKGLLRRSISKTDRRSKALYLTEEGEEYLARLVPRVQRVQEQILAPLNELEQQAFLLLLRKVTEGVNDRSRAPLRTAD